MDGMDGELAGCMDALLLPITHLHLLSLVTACLCDDEFNRQGRAMSTLDQH